MPQSRKKKYNKKKKNPNRAPQNQTRNAQGGAAKKPGSNSANSAAVSSPASRKQMWIALAVALGVFLLLLLIARMTGRNNNAPDAAPDTETVRSGESVASGDASDGETSAAAEAESVQSGDNAEAETVTSGDNDASEQAAVSATSATSGDAVATVASGDATAADAAALQSAETLDKIGIEHADIVVKDYGTISVELDGFTAPITVQNFVSLAKSGFYDGLTFHRIMDGFMIQGGDPLGNGNGGAEHNIVGEFKSNGLVNDISHVRGTISMARASGDENSASSQFFIVQTDSEFLDGDYAGFGHVTSGMDVVDKICKDAKPIDNNGTIKPEEQPVIERITIRES